MAVQPTGVNHVGLSVPNIEEAVEFYKATMGWKLIFPIITIKNDGSPSSKFTDAIYGQEGHSWTAFKMCHMSTFNGTGVELLEFEGNHAPELEFDYKEHGVYHFCITVTNVQEFVDNFVAHGGTQYAPIHERKISDENTSVITFVRDPYGNVIEVYSHGYDYLSKAI